MTRVITYGTFDLLHYGHIRLLERAKSLGDYLIVGVTANDFDKTRGKINVKQSLMERVEAVRATALADEIIIEEYEGQKIDDIQRLNIDIFTVGSDWIGKFDYLNEFCKVVYLDRTQGISSSEIRSKRRALRMGMVGDIPFLNKFYNESKYVDGVDICALYSNNTLNFSEQIKNIPFISNDYDQFLKKIDAVYIVSAPTNHYSIIKKALECGIHVLCESPITTNLEQLDELRTLAKEKKCVLIDALKTAYSMAYSRLLLLVKSGIIGNIISVDATCTSLRNIDSLEKKGATNIWNSICSWGPTAMLPVFQILGTKYKDIKIISNFADKEAHYDNFTKISFIYNNSVASIKVGKGVKSEGELIITGTLGYIYVPAPWWKTDYFEVRYENQEKNKRYFYQLDGEGIRYELVAFVKSIENCNYSEYINENVSNAIVNVIQDFYSGNNCIII